jgi:hypothetical protein
MTPLGWLIIVAVLVALAALTGIKPRGTRPVARTSLMGVARVVLLLLIGAVLYFLFRSS